MPAEEPDPGFRAQAQQRQADQDRTLLAMQQLETALASAAPRREQAWRTGVRAALDVLAETAASEARNAELPDSLLSDIARNQPWLRNRVRGLRLHYRQLQDTIASLRDELNEHGDTLADFADLRQRLSSVLSGLRHQRARESDLIYEAYYDAFGSDVELDANPPAH
jgi:chromosome segregation ATPase